MNELMNVDAHIHETKKVAGNFCKLGGMRDDSLKQKMGRFLFPFENEWANEINFQQGLLRAEEDQEMFSTHFVLSLILWKSNKRRKRFKSGDAI